MTTTRPHIARFVFYSMWLALPFCLLLVLTWNAWRSDSETRRNRLLETAIQLSERAQTDAIANLGQWSPVPAFSPTKTPPFPNDDPKAMEAIKRYNAGDFEGVLGSPESLRSAAGLPLRSLAAIQLLRKEPDPVRLGELVQVLTTALDFTSPPFLEAAERRYSELDIPPPPELADWRMQWGRAQIEAKLLADLDASEPTAWREIDGTEYLIEYNDTNGEWRVSPYAEVRSAASEALKLPTLNLADGLGIHLSVAGKSIAGQNVFPFHMKVLNGWKTEVVLADEDAYLRSEIRTRNFITAFILLAGLSAIFGLVQSGRAYLRAVELARRQSEFMAAVSHEMRTPLAAMGLLAENLESGVADRAGKREEHTKLIRAECSRLGSLVNNVLAFARDGKSAPFEAFDIGAMIADAASLVKPLAVHGQIDFEIQVADFPANPHGDVAAFRRALLNLLDNALKHTPAGGMVICQARPISESWWFIEITDSGPGIPAHERTRIFEPFYRIGDELRRNTPGTGLGLALVKRTVEIHGGRVEVTDAPEGGSRFTLILPLHP